jgi:hypothetical protein
MMHSNRDSRAARITPCSWPHTSYVISPSEPGPSNDGGAPEGMVKEKGSSYSPGEILPPY